MVHTEKKIIFIGIIIILFGIMFISIINILGLVTIILGIIVTGYSIYWVYDEHREKKLKRKKLFLT